MVEVQRKEKETVSGLTRRFSRKVQKSGLLITARGLRFRSRLKSMAQKKKDALHRINKKKKSDQLYKLGKTKKK